jgi:hypothetical protein
MEQKGPLDTLEKTMHCGETVVGDDCGDTDRVGKDLLHGQELSGSDELKMMGR